MEDGQVTLRSQTPADEPFLLELYGGSREQELAMVVGWTDEQKRDFVRMQFTAQSRHYHENYPAAALEIIEVDGQRAGRLYVEPRADDIRIMDILLLPAFQRRGIGTTLLRRVLDQARNAGKSASIHVECFNPAARLYERLGFRHCETNGMYHLMKWMPESVTGNCATGQCREVPV